MLRLIAVLTMAFITAVTAASVEAQATYRAKPGDVLVVEVLEDATLNRAVVILPDGQFNFPFAGSVKGAGLTVGEIQSNLARSIAPSFASTPTVFVSLQPAPTLPNGAGTLDIGEVINIYFLGEVAQPGLREVRPGTTFLQAMAQAGGLTRFAATKRIQLRRTDASGRQKVQSFNYRAMAQGADLTSDTTLRDGDVILVPERRLFE